MPHLIIEYSENLSNVLAIESLVEAMHEAACALEPLPIGGIRTRAIAYQHFRVADGAPDNAFIYVLLRIGEGRSADVKKMLGETLFATLRQHVAALYDAQALSLGFEIQEIDPATRWKQSNVRAYMERRRISDEDRS